MELVKEFFVALHLLGMATIVAGWFAIRLGAGKGILALVWGARVQLLLGILLVGLNEMGGDRVWLPKLLVKLGVALAVVTCAEIANAKAKKDQAVRPLVDVAFGLTVVNVLVATLWAAPSA